MEIVEQILSILTSEYRARAACVCRQWRAASLQSAAVFSVEDRYVAPGICKSQGHLPSWFRRYGQKLRAVRLRNPLGAAITFSSVVFNLLLHKCPELQVLEMKTWHPSTPGMLVPLANLVSCSIAFEQPLPKHAWPFAALKNLVHLIITAEGCQVNIGESPPRLKTLGCASLEVTWCLPKQACQLEVLTLDQVPRKMPGCFWRHPERALPVKTVCLRASRSAIVLSRMPHGQTLQRLLLHETFDVTTKIGVDLSGLTCMQDAILLGPFHVLGLPASLQRLALACEVIAVHVPNFRGCPRLKLVSLGNIDGRKALAVPTGCAVIRGRFALFQGRSKRGVSGQPLDVVPFDKLMEDLDTRLDFLNAWEALWQC